MKKKYDFSGWATKNDLLCSDGRTIRKDAFIKNDGKIVPLVWQHMHDDPANVLGHALLVNRPEGVYTYGFFNDSEKGREAKLLVDHGDVTSLSIYANQLKQDGGNVLHGNIREVSLVLAGANPGAYIENVGFSHSDNGEADDAIIYWKEEDDPDYLELNHDGMVDIEFDDAKEEEALNEDTIAHEDSPEVASDDTTNKGDTKMAEEKEKTMQEVFDEMTEEQKNVVYFMVGQALEGSPEDEEEVEHSDNEGEEMKYNVFEGDDMQHGETLSHAETETIFKDMKKYGSLKDSFLAHTAEYGIEDIDILFPDDKALSNTPDFIKREDSWVDVVMRGVHHTPFSRVKSIHADITGEDARALGYTKGNLKKDEVIALLKRSTPPTTIYKKQKLDRDDIIDITDFDVVAWLKTEMRMMLNEEIARAILIGDGRSDSSDDKISELCIRPIIKDASLYTIQKELSDPTDPAEVIKDAVRARKSYRGSGNPVFFTTEDMLTEMLLLEDGMNRRMYNTVDDLAKALRVSKIVTVPVMENLTYSAGTQQAPTTVAVYGIIVNLNDYNVGADKGGAVSMFDDFDIDYNQQKYLIETRCSGALVKPYSAIVLQKTTANS